jgi:hypothetical protein
VTSVQPLPERAESTIEPGPQLIRVRGLLGQQRQHSFLLHSNSDLTVRLNLTVRWNSVKVTHDVLVTVTTATPALPAADSGLRGWRGGDEKLVPVTVTGCGQSAARDPVPRASAHAGRSGKLAPLGQPPRNSSVVTGLAEVLASARSVTQGRRLVGQLTVIGVIRHVYVQWVIVWCSDDGDIRKVSRVNAV